jgi:hypothetical protein
MLEQIDICIFHEKLLHGIKRHQNASRHREACLSGKKKDAIDVSCVACSVRVKIFFTDIHVAWPGYE